MKSTILIILIFAISFSMVSCSGELFKRTSKGGSPDYDNSDRENSDSYKIERDEYLKERQKEIKNEKYR